MAARLLLPLILALAAGAAAAGDLAWIPTWFAGPAPVSGEAPQLRNMTIRQMVHISAGGKYVRLRLSNAYGHQPLHFDKVSLALRDSGSLIRSGSAAVTFGGIKGVTVAPGGFAVSDAIPFEAPPGADLAVSLYASGPVEASTAHLVQRSAIYFADGDAAETRSLAHPAAAPTTGQSWLWLEEVEVAGSTAKAAIVTFGDSITDGVGPAPDTYSTWPDILVRRFASAGIDLGVANAGIGGNRLLHDASWPPFGEAACVRFDEAVLAQPNIQAVIVLIGINDIGQVGERVDARDYVSAAEIEAGLARLAERAHEKKILVYAGTLLPFRGMPVKGYYSDEKEAERQAVNAWIRGTNAFDGVIDFDKAMEDPAAPGQLRPAYDSGDHLHPSAEGDRALADAVPLRWFQGEPAPNTTETNRRPK